MSAYIIFMLQKSLGFATPITITDSNRIEYSCDVKVRAHVVKPVTTLLKPYTQRLY